MIWTLLQRHVTPEDLGLLPGMLDAEDPRPAREQFDAHYQHGGGWRPMLGHKLIEDYLLKYPGDPPLEPIAISQLRDETIVLYPYAFVAIVQSDHSFEVARMD